MPDAKMEEGKKMFVMHHNMMTFCSLAQTNMRETRGKNRV
jgi:hypothetical protein